MKWLWVLLFIVVITPMIFNSQLYLSLNNDSVSHLVVFNAIKDGGNPQFLYLGQKLTGYSLVWINKITHIDIAILFMWFNFLSLYLAGISVGWMVKVTTKNRIASFLSACVIIFGVLSTLRLFMSGTIFNIIDILFFVPIILAFIYKMVDEKNPLYLFIIIPLSVFTYYFHSSFGYNAPIAPPLTVNQPVVSSGFENTTTLSPYLVLFSLLGAGTIALLMMSVALLYKQHENISTPNKVVLVLLGIMAIGMFIGGYIGITEFSTRLLINSTLFIGIGLSIIIGLVYKNNKYSLIYLFFILVGISQNLINWIGVMK